MKYRLLLWLLPLAWLAFPQTSPAPIVYHPDTGWQTEGKVPLQDDPKAQIAAAKQCEAKKDWENALNNYRVTARLWPTSPLVPEARMGEARMLETLGDFGRAFDAYQKLIEKFPNDERFNDILRRQYEIANRFLAGERLRVWKIKTLPSMDKTSEMYEKIINNGPYSEVAPMCQMKIGEARDKQKLYEEAVRSYQKLIDNYPTSSLVSEAYYRIGHSYLLQASRSDYDQSAANRAALAFDDFVTRYPKDEHVAHPKSFTLDEKYNFVTQYPDEDRVATAHESLKTIQTEQARGLWNIAQYYDRTLGDPVAALIYYNDLIVRFPKSTYGEKAKPRLEELKRKTAPTPATNVKEGKSK